MIVKNEVMNLLLESCPTYKSRYNNYLKENYDVGEEQLLYVDVGDFCLHLVELYKQNRINEFNDMFNVIEKLHIEGDEYVKELATIGILEGIQNSSLNKSINPEDFVKYLLPESKKWWQKLNEFWEWKTQYVGDNRR